MTRIVGFLAAFMALSAGLIAREDPITNLTHAGLAFFFGWAATTVWKALFASTSVYTVANVSPNEIKSEKSVPEQQEAA